ncbi:610_t:CDS:2, partial [Racocetra persica]
ASKRNLRKKKLRTIKKAKIEKSDSSIVGEAIKNNLTAVGDIDPC